MMEMSNSDKVSPAVVKRLVYILVTYAGIDTKNERLGFLENAGLTRLQATLPLEGTTQTFAETLIRECRRVGQLPPENTAAFDRVVAHLREVVQGHPDLVEFLAGLSRPGPSALPDSVDPQEPLSTEPPPATDTGNPVDTSVALLGSKEKEPVPFAKGVLAQNITWVLGSIISLITIVTFALTFYQNDTDSNGQETPPPATFLIQPTETTSTRAEIPTVRPEPSEAVPVPPVDPANLTQWLRQVANDKVEVGAAQAALMAAGLLADPADWNTTHDLTGDGVAEWVVVTAPTARGCRNLLITNPATSAPVHNANAYVGVELRTEVQILGDISGDGIDDLLYSHAPCAANALPATFTLYTVQTIEGDTIGASNRYGYLRLLLANEVMTQGRYRDAAEIYQHLTFEGGAGIGMGWEHPVATETTAVKSFAGVRLLLADYLADRAEGQVPGSDEGVYEEYVAEFPDSPYLTPVTVMVNSLRVGESPESACAAFRAAVANPSMLTYPLNDMGVLVLGVAEVCPF